VARRNPPRAVKPAKQEVQTRQHSLIWLQGLLCGAVVTLATPTALLLGVLLGPGLLVLLFDRQPGSPVARCVLLCAMAASVDPLQTLWTTGHSLATASALLSDLRTVGVSWSAAGAGWLMAEAFPLAIRAVMEVLGRSRSVRLRAERARLVEEWGLE
jgi:hypothetical protein